MAETPYKGYALYEPDASPDLTESGEYNTALMAVDADMHDEEQARIEGDTALNIAIANEMAQRKAADDALNGRVDSETAERNAADDALNGRVDTETAERNAADAALDTAYKAADTALGNRIDNAEAEISANSADLTGIKGLTYGDTHVNFLENSNGEYSSPALEKIAEQAAAAGWSTVTIESYTGTLTHDELTQLKANWPHVMISVGGVNFLYPKTFIGDNYEFLSVLPSTRGSAYADGLKVNANTGEHLALNTFYAPYWSKVSQKPFSTIGTGLKVVDNALTVDTAATPAGITANTTWSELESAMTQP